jgi:hypothetical protein
MKNKLYRFMQGRYGNDMLNKILMGLMFVCIILSFFGQNIFYVIGLILMCIIYFRIFSRNTYKRAKENQMVMKYYNHIRNFYVKQKKIMKYRKTHHIYSCSSCKQKIKIPKGKGKIVVKCPKCKNEFIKKS